MAQAQRTLAGDLDDFVGYLDQVIAAGSVTASVEAGDERAIGDARMVLRVYERGRRAVA